MLVQQEKPNCSGCSACYAACPADAIVMMQDEEGFLYPQIQEQKCLHCDLCLKVCPLTPDHAKEHAASCSGFQQRYYAVRAKDAQILSRSRSGGAFYLLAMKILQQGGSVYGTALNPEHQAVFAKADHPEQLSAMQGSKYVQSDMTEGFEEIRQALISGKKPLLFVGTACQTAGLLSFLRLKKCDTQHLYTADFVCHGVPSPLLWQDNLQELEQKWKLTITEVNFRDKALGWRSHIESYRGMDSHGRLSPRKYSNKYTTIFCSGAALRPSCHQCRFCSFERPSDLTLGDFWGAETAGLQKEAENGMSQVMINTRKGAGLIESLPGADLFEITKEAVSRQPNLFHPTAVSPQRDQFWQLYREKGYTAAANAFYPWIERIKVPYNRLKCRISRRKTETVHD